MIVVKPTYTPRYINSTGLMLVPNSPTAFLQAVSDGEVESNITFFHEVIHHLQMISSSYLITSNYNLLLLSTKLITKPESKDVNFFAKEFARQRKAFRYRAFGVSVEDICEGMAVLGSFRFLWPNADVEKFISFRNAYFSGKGNSPYRRTFDILAEYVGFDDAYKILPIISFLALQGDLPGRSFEILLQEHNLSKLISNCDSAIDAINDLGYDTILTNLDMVRCDKLHPSQRHMIFYPILRDVTNRIELTKLIDLFVFFKNFRNLQVDLQSRLYPPLIVGAYKCDSSSAAGQMYGLALEDVEFRDSITMFTSMLFATDKITNIMNHPMICPHESCSEHDAGICSGWVTIPLNPDDCGFRYYIESATNKTPTQVNEILLENLNHEEINEISNSNDTSTLFPSIESIDLMEEDTHAEKFDAKYLLDEEDNDNALIITCKKCLSLINGDASIRQIDQGLKFNCPNCGSEIFLSREDFNSIRID